MRRMLQLTVLVAVLGAALPSAASADSVIHCALVTGSEDFSPALDLTPTPTTLTVTANGTGCVEINASGDTTTDDRGTQVGTGATTTRGTVSILGTFQGTASTLTSSFSGSGSFVFHPDNGDPDQVLDFTATCSLMVSGTCPFIGTFETDDEPQGSIEMTPGPAVNINLLGPVPSIHYYEIALLTLLMGNNNNNAQAQCTTTVNSAANLSVSERQLLLAACARFNS